MNKIWFTSDQHFFDNSIIEACRPQFNSVREMNQFIIAKHNELVYPEDTVYYLGDYARNASFEELCNITSLLNGKKHLILGNHDMYHSFEYIKMGFWSTHTSLQMELANNTDAILIHDPVASCINRKCLFICGHVHDFFEALKNVINVCMEVRDYKPLSLDDVLTIKSKMEQRGV